MTDVGDVVLIDVDAGSVTTPFNDVELLPNDVVRRGVGILTRF